MSRVRPLFRHLRNCSRVRQLLANRESTQTDELYWYDMRLRDAVSPAGIARVAGYALSARRRDEVFGNYGLNSIYYADTCQHFEREDVASVWNCRAISGPAFYPADDAIADELRTGADRIRAEFEQVMERIDTHPDSSGFATDGRWTGLFLSGTQGKLDSELAERCPETSRILSNLPVCRNFGFVAFSGMEPGTKIKPHAGSSNLRLRYHLGIHVPEPDKGRIRVGREWRHWHENEVLAFDDSYEHEVVYEGSEARIILIVDVWHPMLDRDTIEVLSDPVFGHFGK